MLWTERNDFDLTWTWVTYLLRSKRTCNSTIKISHIKFGIEHIRTLNSKLTTCAKTWALQYFWHVKHWLSLISGKFLDSHSHTIIILPVFLITFKEHYRGILIWLVSSTNGLYMFCHGYMNTIRECSLMVPAKIFKILPQSICGMLFNYAMEHGCHLFLGT